MFVQQGPRQRFRPPKAGALQLADCSGEINQAALGGKIEEARRTGDAKPLLFGGAYAPAVID
jgi:hypothetical protein